MLRYIIRRIILMLVTLWVISILMFSLMKLMPQDPVALAMPSYVKITQKEAVYEQLKEEMGLNDSVIVQYTRWLSRTIRGDLGTSLTYKKPVNSVIAQPLMNTFRLNACVLIVSILLALFTGIMSALYEDSMLDRFLQSITLFGISIPGFFLALILIYVFAFQLHLLPSGGTWLSYASFGDNLKTMVLPVMTLSLLSFASIHRFFRDTLIEVFHQEYITACIARGLSKTRILLHALRGAALPLITLLMNEVSMLFIGSVLIEYVFAYDGIGRVLLTALNRRDYMLVIALNFLYAILYLACNLIADILYGFADPRVKAS